MRVHRLRRYTDAVERIDIPQSTADLVMDRVNGILKAAIHQNDFLQAVALGCYLQGATDMLRPEMIAALKDAKS